MFCQCMNKDSNFLPLGVLSGFYRVASVNSVQVTPVQFSTSAVLDCTFDKFSAICRKI